MLKTKKMLSLLTHCGPLYNGKIALRLSPAVHQLFYGTSLYNQHERALSHCSSRRRILCDKTVDQQLHHMTKRCQSSGMFFIDDTLVSCAEAYFLFIHSLGLEWWLAIPAAAIPMRIGMSLLIGRILMPKFQKLHQVDNFLERRWHFYVGKMKEERSKLLASGYRSPEQLGELMMKNLQADRKKYLAYHSCRPSVILVTSLLPLPLWLTMTSALRRIGGIPSWRDWYHRMQELTPCESMLTEGCLWFQDLSAADPYHVLPVLTSAIFLLATEFMAINNTNVSGYMRYVWRTLMIFNRCWLVMFAALCWNMPAGVGYYWVISAMTALSINVSATFNKRLHLLVRGFPCPHEKPGEAFVKKARKHYGFSKEPEEEVPVNRSEVLKALKESSDPIAMMKARLRR